MLLMSCGGGGGGGGAIVIASPKVTCKVKVHQRKATHGLNIYYLCSIYLCKDINKNKVNKVTLNMMYKILRPP